MLLIVISLSLLYLILGKLTLNPVSPNSFFSFKFYGSFPTIFLLVNPLNFLQFYWLLLFTFESFDKLYIRPEFSISLGSEDSMINAETAVYIFSYFCWCSICCLCKQLPFIRNRRHERKRSLEIIRVFQAVKSFIEIKIRKENR